MMSITEDQAKEIAAGISAAMSGDTTLLARAYELATTVLPEAIRQWRWETVDI
jgi:hypothetical protein